MTWRLYTCDDCQWQFYKLPAPAKGLCSWCERKPRQAHVEASLSLIESIEARVVPIANPSPSREEWETLKKILLRA